MHTAHIDPLSNPHRVQTCADHWRSVADLAKDILAPCGLSATGYLTGLLHDCGKFTDEFDDYIIRASNNEQVRKGSVIHTFAGVRYMLEQFYSPGKQSLSDIAAEIIAVCIGSHHGLIDLWDERHQSGFEHRLKHQPAYDQQAIASFFEECATQNEVEQLFNAAEQEVQVFFQHKLSACARKRKELCYALGLLVRLLTSAIVEADRTDTRCFMDSLPFPQNNPTDWAECAERVDA